MIEIPIQIPTGGAFDILEIVLDDVVIGFTFKYNARIDSWFVSVQDENGDAIFGDVRMVVGWPIFGFYRDLRMPPGLFFLEDREELGVDPVFDELGSRFAFIYVTEQDLVDENLEVA